MNYFTQNDEWDSKHFYREIQENEALIRQEARNYSQYLKEKQQTTKQTYMKEIDKLEETLRKSNK